MSSSPSSQPLITLPAPSLNSKGTCRREVLSNVLPDVRRPCSGRQNET